MVKNLSHQSKSHPHNPLDILYIALNTSGMDWARQSMTHVNHTSLQEVRSNVRPQSCLQVLNLAEPCIPNLQLRY